MKRTQMPMLSGEAQTHLVKYAHYLELEQDVSPATRRNYLSDVRQFMAWCESRWQTETDASTTTKVNFNPQAVGTPLLVHYRQWLQQEQHLKPNSINRYLVSLKRYFEWAVTAGILSRDPARAVKLGRQEQTAPRFIDDKEEEALMAAVTSSGNLRDRTILTLMLHTGLRAQETCQLQLKDVQLGRRGGLLRVNEGKGNKSREIPLNATVRPLLKEYIGNLADTQIYLFASSKTAQGISVRALGQLLAKYTKQANLRSVSPHDLRHRFGYQMAKQVPLHRLAQIMGHDSLNTTLIYTQGTQADLQREVEKIAWQ